MRLPDQSIDPVYAAVTLIQFPNSQGHATGFFFIDSNDDPYIITNHHVIRPEDHETAEGDNPDEIRILIRGSANAEDLEFYDKELYDGSGGKNWIEHPSGSDVDVAAIPIDIDLSQKGSIPLSRANFLPDDAVLGAGEEAMIIGYPFKGERPYLPVIRSALISSPYGSPFQGTPSFATDANMHSGTSGSPVLTLPSATLQREDSFSISSGQQTYLIGVHSASLHSDHPEEEGPLNINVAWYVGLLNDMIP